MAENFKQAQGESFKAFEARRRAAQQANVVKAPKTKRARADNRTADRIDGYDRDDIGFSNDY